ncbi:hypothetical protein CCAX7_33120 [Capsulimonas corticalis]|uniref:Uncharacterized protein n=1 Tax=Capsulimonas corticalis TaxID=2219043 RepID=A0A402CYL4_9BACT|nr:hypothetical protein [Capsulimonas corticalis]BDI31261.1 hypothetical protein CCAX7_33120 [Capsulimonas corticalis]
MTTRIILCVCLVAAAAYGAYEIRFWRTSQGRQLISPRQRVLRSIGLFLLLAAMGLWLGGTYLPVPLKHGPVATRAERAAALRYLAYWTLTALTALPLIPLALLDARANIQQVQGDVQEVAEERRRLKQEASASNLPED